MELLKIENIFILTILFVPGFIYLKAYRLFIAETKTDFSKDLYEAIGFSFLNAIIFSYPLYTLNCSHLLEQNPFFYFLIMLLIILVAPILGAIIFSRISQTKWFGKFMINPTKSAWDSFFARRESYYVKITLKDGRKIGGKYGKNSYSSTYPNPKEIFIEEHWLLDKNNDFDVKEEQTEGILITENEISTIEFYI